MAIPDYQTLMLPVLQAAATGDEVSVSGLVELLAGAFSLSGNERVQLLPSGRQTVIANRVHWARTYLSQAGLVERTGRGRFRITQRGRDVLGANPARVDNQLLTRFPEFNEFRKRRPASTNSSSEMSPSTEVRLPEDRTPEEILRAAHRQIEESLAADLLARILAAPADFFEALVLDLLLAMGYGGPRAAAGRHLGKSGDGGVDGVIDQDALGLDRVYVQAKRYRADQTIGPEYIRSFSGSLNVERAAKDVFVTTSSFSKSAIETARNLTQRVVLIDGNQLATLMTQHNVGVRVDDTVEIKKLDEDYFEL